MILVAHRGLSRTWGDNNLLSFHKAVDTRKFGAIEMDIQLAPWGDIVVNHDLIVDNFTDKYLSFESLMLELKIPKEIKIFLDIKGPSTIVPQLEDFFKNNPQWPLDQFVMCSFNINTLKAFRLPFEQGFISDNVFRTIDLENIFDNRIKNFLVYWGSLDMDVIEYCRMKNIKVFVYTPETMEQISFSKMFKPSGLIVNCHVHR